MDLVGHDGGVARGDFLRTLTLTDPATGWTELATCRNKSQFHVLAAPGAARARLTFPLLGLHCDNGGEFLNTAHSPDEPQRSPS